MEECGICGKRFKQLGPHLGTKHPEVGLAYYEHRPGQLAKRLAGKAVRQGECLLWNGAKSSDGYGMVVLYGKRLRAHRVAVWVRDGTPPGPGEVVIHKCDNPLCIEPSHLVIGTHRGNAADRDAKDRRGRARFTNQQVERIRAAMPWTDVEVKALCASLDAPRQVVVKMLVGLTFRDVPGPRMPRPGKGMVWVRIGGELSAVPRARAEAMA